MSSYWPPLASLSGLSLLSSFVVFFKIGLVWPMNLSLFSMVVISMMWWKDVCREGGMEGKHILDIQDSMKLGMFIFIFSEVLFFGAWFWSFFHSSLSTNLELGLVWPPVGVVPLHPFQVPLLNTIILLSSGVMVTWAHHSLVANLDIKYQMGWTLGLGFSFTALQLFEYYSAMFSLADSVYGSSFFISTGFHGIHVLVGSLFLLAMSIRSIIMQINSNHHLGLEFAIWYWHFVDVVWLFLFSFMYWWGW